MLASQPAYQQTTASAIAAKYANATLASSCTKFSANQFNRHKCQTCFRSRHAHSQTALESAKVSVVWSVRFVFSADDRLSSNPK